MDSKKFYKLGLNIFYLRKKFNESQSDLAECIDVSKNAVSNYESGKRIPEKDVLIKIAKHYRITLDELLNGNYSDSTIYYDKPFYDAEYNKKCIDHYFFYEVNDEAMKNDNFRNAYRIQNEFYEICIVNQKEYDFNNLFRCIELYNRAVEDGVFEGAVNIVYCSSIICFILSIITPQMLEKLKDIRNKKIKEYDLPKELFLWDVQIECNEEYVEFAKEKTETLRTLNLELFKNLNILKNSEQYTDLAYYYLAISYLFNIVINNNSNEKNKEIGMEMLLSFAKIGNNYAIGASSSIENYKS